MSKSLRLRDSLYLRLALVLLVALAASYGTMYALFLSHLDETRLNSFSRTIAVQVTLIEEFLETRPAAELPALKGLVIAPALPDLTPDDVERRQRAALIKEHLDQELGRPVQVVAALTPAPGLWVDLRPGGGATQWLFLPTPKLVYRRSDSLVFALVVGFLVVFVGGMFLLWQVQRPLKRLVTALEAIGPAAPPQHLGVSGVGISRILIERYNEMAERQRRHEEDRAIMLAGVAHDLRTPITRLRLLLELQNGERRAELNQNLGEIERITEQFLAFARSDDDEAASDHDLKAFVQEVAAPYRERAVAVSDTAADGIVAAIRPNALRRALVNLIENALEYGAPPILIDIRRGGDDAAIAVTDEGRGIPERDMARATRPFTRLDASRGGKGHCGLGLAIVAGIAESHGGRLVLRRRTPAGFAAEIHLPGAAAA
ncbi:MAG: ATP-binding protein [Rhodocyclaceae bacterium]|nr:ATP-binding protein [Rhodocyclaceae bacterium]